MYAQYKACTSVKKPVQFASLILACGMQICVSLYHSRFCRSASCNHLDPEAVITHSGIQMFKCKLRLSNPPRLVSSALHGKAHLSFFGSCRKEHTASIHPVLRSWNTKKEDKHKHANCCWWCCIQPLRELKPKATLLFCRMRALLEIRFSWRAQVVAGLSR